MKKLRRGRAKGLAGNGSKVAAIPYGPWATFFATIAIFFASQFAAVIVLSVYAGLRGMSGAQASDWASNSVIAQFWMVLFIETAVVCLLILLLQKRHATLQTIGLVRVKLRDAGLALVGFAIYFPVLIASTQLISILIPSLNVNQKQDIGFSTSTTGWPLGLVFVSLVILPPIVEELLFRGFLYGGLRGKLKQMPAALITSVLFAVPHILGSGSLLWIAGLDTFILSMVLTFLREETGSVWPGIFLHMLKNGVAFLSLFVFHLA